MSDVVLEMRNITKIFPGVKALDNVSFACVRGEVHALVGENGAGKSTLMKILAGVYQPDAGQIILRGRPTRISSPYDAQRLGIAIIYQELNLLPELTVAENMFLGREPRGPLGFVDSRKLCEQAQALLKQLGVELNLRTPVRRLSVAQQQMVEIAKALSLNADLIIMDEPSATLGGCDLEHLFQIIPVLQTRGVTVIYISHRLEEVFQIAQRVTVLKDGQLVSTCRVEDIDKATLIRMMVGRALSDAFPKKSSRIGEEILVIQGLTCGGVLKDIDIKVHRGEIVGLAGLVGSGRTELAHAIFGLRAIDAGEIYIKGKRVQITRPSEAMAHSIGFLTEDRKAEGLVLGLSLRHNAALPSLNRRQRLGFVDEAQERRVVQDMVKRLDLRAPNIDQEVQYLSGGNQQKVVLAKWLISGPDLLIFDEPTRGIDVGAKAEIWHLMRQLADQGTAILMISSELPEVIGMSDRIVVMHQGSISGELPGDGATEEQIMTLATGGVLTCT